MKKVIFKKIGIAVILAGIGLILLFKYFNYKVEEDLKLKQDIMDVIKSSEQIDYSLLTDFEWDTLYLLTPYSDYKQVLKKDYVRGYNRAFGGIQYNDGMNILVFVKSKKIITYVTMDTRYLYFKYIYEKIPKNKAISKIVEENGIYSLYFVKN